MSATFSRDFRLYWMGQALSVLGDSFSFIALPLLVLEATGSVVKMGLLTATYGLGFFLSGLFAGVVVDRADRRRLMIVCDLIRFVLHALIPLSWWLLGPRIEVLFVVVLFSALVGNLFQVGAITAVANLVEKEQLIAANGRLESTYSSCFLIGPMLAGLVMHAWGAQLAIAVDAFTFLLSALFLSQLRFQEKARPRENAKGLSAMLSGIVFLWRQPVLRWIMLTMVVSNLFISAHHDLVAFRVKREMGFGDDAVGLVFGLGSIGSVAGGMLAVWLKQRFGFSWSFLCAGFGVALATLWIGQADSLYMLIPGLALLGGSHVIRGVNSMSFRQSVTPDHLLGRVTAAFWCLIATAGPLGAMLVTGIAERYGAGLTLSLTGVGLLLCALTPCFTPIATQEHSERARSAA